MKLQNLSLLKEEDSCSIVNESWYMSRISRAVVVKVLVQVDDTSKQRPIVDILGISYLGRRSCRGKRSSSRNVTKPLCQLPSEKTEVRNSNSIGTQRLSRKATATIDEGGQMDTSSDCSPNSFETFGGGDNHTSRYSLELVLEDSVSNSSDNASLGQDISSIGAVSNTQISKHGIQNLPAANDTTLVGGNKRFSVSSVACPKGSSGADDDDDDWTLERWKEFKDRGPARKRRRKLTESRASSSNMVASDCLAFPESHLHVAYNQMSALESDRSESVQSRHLPKKCVASANFEVDHKGFNPLHVGTSISDQMSSLKIISDHDNGGVSKSSDSPFVVRLELEEESESVPSEDMLPERLRASKWDYIQDSDASSTVEATSDCRTAAFLHAGKKQEDIKPLIPKSSIGESSLLRLNSASDRPKLPREAAHCALAANSTNRSSPVGLRLKQLDTAASGNGSELTNSMQVANNAIDIGLHLIRNSRHVPRHTGQTNAAGSPERSVCIKSEGQAHDRTLQQVSIKEYEGHVPFMDRNENLDIEEEKEVQREPAKLPCKRKTISPMSQEFLLKASKLGDSGFDSMSKESGGWTDVMDLGRNPYQNDSSLYSQKIRANDISQIAEYRKGSDEVFSERVFLNSLTTPAEKHVPEAVYLTPQQTSERMQAASSTFLCVSQSSRRIPNAPQSSRTYPKGILRSNSQGCQGCCSCEECESLRTRARNASEFSQRQMQDIETVTMKLLKGLNILRTIVEERLIQNSVNQDSQVDISLDQVKKATISALEAEKTAKKWLNRMARDCNRYCKIMRMQGRRLSFADESGGKLCHVKVFQSEL